MSVGTAVGIGTAIAGVATAGASIYGANKQSNAATTAAKTTSDAATKSAQIQSDAAEKTAAIQAASDKQALDYERAQSQLSLDQYNQQQTRLQPYRNLGNFALGMPSEAAPAPLRLPPVSGSTSAAASTVPSGDYQSWFQNLIGGKPLDQKGLLALKPQLDAAGVQITPPSAAGVVSKIGLPDGTWVRVLNGDTNVASPTVWIPQGGTGGSSSAQAGPVTLNYTPSRMLASYRPLSQIAGV